MTKTLAPLLSASALLAGGFLVLTGMKSCGSASSSDDNDPDSGICKVAAECEGLPHVQCVGQWSCDAGQCNYTCGQKPDVVVPNPNACNDDAQCGAGKVCSYDYGCQPSACSPDGSLCTTDCLGLCVDAPKLAPCTGNSDCAPGQWCDFTECVGTACEGVCRGDEPPPPAGCTTDAECKAGQYCQLSACPPCNCPDGNFAACTCPACTGTCFDKDVEPACWSDDMCGPGFACRQVCSGGAAPAEADGAMPPSDGDAAFPAPPGMCTNQCVPVEPQCSSDAECGAGMRCEIQVCADCACAAGDAACTCPDPSCWGSCVPTEGAWCNDDAMCGPGMHCSNDLCYGCDALPNDPKGCPEQPYCEGTCQYDDVKPQCSTDADCPAGSSCQCTSDPSCPMCDVCYFQCVETGPVTCFSDAECGADEYCAPSACFAIPCDANGNCSPCPGTCQAKPVTSCTTDADCGKGEVCVFDGPAAGDAFAPPCWDGLCPPPVGQCKAQEPVSACQVSGCSGEICAAEPMASDCMWSEWYVCFQFSTCGLSDAAGGCGWAPTPEYVKCLAGFGMKP